MELRLHHFAIGIFICILACAGCNPNDRNTLTIATSANMQFTMEALIEAFSEETGIACRPVVSSSGKLTAQITEGAPYDILVSADLKYPAKLYQQGLTTGPPEIYAYGKLVLWRRYSNAAPTLELLMSDTIRHIAIANPRTAPYGIATLEFLKHEGLYGHVVNKLVYGESLAQANQFVLSGAADAGFTSKSVVLSKVMQGKANWVELNPTSYDPIAQGIVLIKGQQRHVKHAAAFRDFLFSEKGKAILDKFGYTVPD